MKQVHCSGCSIVVAQIENGSQLRKGISMLCSKCEDKRTALEMKEKFGYTKPDNPYGDILNNLFKGK